MDAKPQFGRQQLLSHIVNDMARALCQRRDEPQARQLARAQGTAQSVLAFLPGDAIEAMIAGHCVMFHELIVDTVQTTLRGEPEATRRATRSGIVAMDKAFGANLVRLERYRARDTDARSDAAAGDAAPADTRAETDIADRVHRHQAGAASTAVRPSSVAAEASAPAPDAIDPGRASPEAIPPLDAPRPSHILGFDPPREGAPATVAPMPGLNRQARRALRRQSGKRIDPGASPIANASLVRHIHP
jgi:hypothetical protein